MTIQNNYLTNVAKAINQESFSVPTHHGVTDDDSFTMSNTLSGLTGEIGSRNEATSSRNSQTIVYNSLRVGVSDVVDTVNGDTLEGAALFDAISSGNVQIAITLPGTLQTQDFDLEFDYEVTFERSE